MPGDLIHAVRRHLASAPVRWALAAVLAFALAAAVIAAFITFRANVALTERTIDALQSEASSLLALGRAPNGPGLAGIVAEQTRVAGNASAASFYGLFDEQGSALAGSLKNFPIWARTSQVGTIRLARGDEAVGFGIAVANPVATEAGRLTLVVGRDTRDLSAFTDEMRRTLLAGMLVLALIGIGGGLAASRALLRRLDAISQASRAIMAGDLTGRVATDGSDDEFDRVAWSLNAMLARNEELTEALREVSGNIAHDLKTPLNRLRNSAEAALRDPAGAPAYRTGLARVIDEADGLIRTFNALLLIARLEAGSATEAIADIDAAAIARDVAELYEPVAEEAGVVLRVAADGNAPLRANRELVGQAVANMIDNALKYGRPAGGGGETMVRVARAGPDVEISVADRGSGIATADRERVLKRFVRLEGSRSAPGSGLGLSLVAAVARLYGGGVRLEDNAPGLRIVLALPAATVGPAP